MPIHSNGVQPPAACNLPKAQIEGIAVQVGKHVGFEPGGRIADAVERLGGTIEFLRWEDWLAHEASDTIEVRGQRDFTIRLLGVDGPLRHHFTIAHELGHYVLHSQFGKIAPMVAGRKGSNRVEWEANWFAASLLMPEESFSTAVNEGLSDMHLAARFNVSMEAAQVRKRVLGF
jgi:hypothetical protein